MIFSRKAKQPDRAVPTWDEGRATIRQSYDPGLKNVAHLRP